MTKKSKITRQHESSLSESNDNKFFWNRSTSEPDLTDPNKLLERFTIRCPHEYISVDELKFFRRKKPPGILTDFHTTSQFCLYNKDDPVLPFSLLKSEYMRCFKNPLLIIRPELKRTLTSLKLQEGLMDTKSEQKSQYHRYDNEEILSSRQYPIKNPENLTLEGAFDMSPEYRSSFISYPFVDRTTKILPREAFRVDGELDINGDSAGYPNQTDKLAPQKVCHLKVEGELNYMPEYRSQYVSYPIEKSHSIPQLSNINFRGAFVGIPEYRDSFRMYDNYSKSAPIKKADHLTMNGEIKAVPEYKEKFVKPITVEKTQPLKTDDHLHPRGEFTKDVAEYFESFKDPQVRQMPERGKCRETYLRLKGNIEFNPEYRSTYLNHPRSRPVIKKSTSSLRISNNNRSPFGSPRRKFKSTSPSKNIEIDPTVPLTSQPEYRRAQYNYQLRERTPTRKLSETLPDGNSKTQKKNFNANTLKEKHDLNKPQTNMQKTRAPRSRRTSTTEYRESFENIGENQSKKPPKFGRRASITRNAQNCRENSSIIEGNPKYASRPTNRKSNDNNSSFLVLDDSCNKSNAWMKKSWYDT